MTKTSRPLLPARLAVDTLEEVRQFVGALNYARRVDTHSAIRKCLFEDQPMVKGPFVSLNLPFVSATQDAKWPLDDRLRQSFAPYAHQLKAYERLGGDQPQNTLVTTGTGSGKSECFIMPVLDYVLRCKEQGKTSGVKALIIYPMNALIEDQGERLCRLANELNQKLSSDRRLRIGRYTGERGRISELDPAQPHQIIDDRDALCEDPPDVLLTNYRMLDFMLFRPQEQSFWNKATQDVFRYLVLDELHTFDGAQGADVACLIRRLRLKLGSEFTCVGTSATVAKAASTTKTPSPNASSASNDTDTGSDTDTDTDTDADAGQQGLCDFAGTLFGSPFDHSSVIAEERLSQDEYLQPVDAFIEIPAKALDITGDENVSLSRTGMAAYEPYLQRLADNWQAPMDPFERGEWLLRHPLTKEILSKSQPGHTLKDLAKSLGLSQELLTEYLDLLASSRTGSPQFPRPVLSFNAQVWVSETPYLVRQLSKVPKFQRSSELEDEAPLGYLPAVNCSDCGLSGWAMKVDESATDDGVIPIDWNRNKILSAYHNKEAVALFPRAQGSESDPKQSDVYYDVHSRCIIRQQGIDLPTKDCLPLTVSFFNEDSQSTSGLIRRTKKSSSFTRCPGCDGSLTLQLSGIRTSMLGSVIANVFLAHGANPDDRKLLVFNDSVQDAAHQAGYMGARGLRFNIRKHLWQLVRKSTNNKSADNEAGLTLAQLAEALYTGLHPLWQKAHKSSVTDESREARRELLQLIPKDLWELWQHQQNIDPFSKPTNLDQLVERLVWEFWLELTVRSGLGWSLKKVNLLSLQPNAGLLAKWEASAEEAAALQGVQIVNVRTFVAGLMDRMISRGFLYQEQLAAYYEEPSFNLYPYLRGRDNLRPILGFQKSGPRILALPGGKDKGSYDLSSNLVAKSGRTWFQRWAERHISWGEPEAGKSGAGEPRKTKAAKRFLESLMSSLGDGDAGLVKVQNGQGVVLASDALRVSTAPLQRYHCATCQQVAHLKTAEVEGTMSCTQNLCEGLMTIVSDDKADQADSFADYLGALYRRPVEAPFPHAHTGQLKIKDRQMVERAFKDNLLPGDPLQKIAAPDGARKSRKRYLDHPVNVLSCTPTLEMGIDIGSLSGVMLRGFPGSLASTKQRLGRSGRKTGNALNVVLSRSNRHDRYHWQDPSTIFTGSVDLPGCHFRTRDILLRQFHAYLFDLWAGQTSAKALPSPKSIPHGESLANQPYWSEFKVYLKGVGSSKGVVNDFLDSIERDGNKLAGEPQGSVKPAPSPDNKNSAGIETTYNRVSLMTYLATALDVEDGLWSKIRSVLHHQDQDVVSEVALSQDQEDIASKAIEDSNSRSEDYSVDDDPEHEVVKESLAQASEGKERVAVKSKHEYTLKLLADQGVLPNYAFPTEGVRFDTLVTLYGHQVVKSGRKRPATKIISITRPPLQALRELAPGQNFYVDGFKAPVTRIELPEVATVRAYCGQCGTAFAVEGGDSEGSEGRLQSCQICPSEILTPVQVVEPTVVHSRGGFSDLQIRDQDEDRSVHPIKVEPYFNYGIGGDEQGARYRSDEERQTFEFRTDALINLVVRSQKDGKSHRGFEICAGCGAVPYRITKDTKQFNCKGRGNRHHYSCEYFRAGEDIAVKTISVALAHGFHSDTIRFKVEQYAKAPTIAAVLQLAMRLHLGGRPAHLGILTTLLNNPRSVWVTLYDQVPGGTGHLKGLMPLSDPNTPASIDGWPQLRKLFTKTRNHLANCCETGCYACLLSSENRHHHDRISKKIALAFLDSFVAAEDWRRESLDIAASHDLTISEDSVLEDNFISLFRDNPNRYLIADWKAKQVSTGDGCDVMDLQHVPRSMYGSNVGEGARIVHTPDDKVPITLSGSRIYTKPDFTAYQVGRKAPVTYIYLDGAGPHLGDAKTSAGSVFRRDVGLRTALLEEKKGHGTRVLSYSTRMIDAWSQWVRSDGCRDKDTGERLRNLATKEHRGKRYHKLMLTLVDLTQGKVQASEKSDELYAAFVGLTLGEALTSGDAERVFMTEKEKLQLKEVLGDLRSAGKRQTKVAAGLTLHYHFAKSSKIDSSWPGVFELNDDRDLRLGANGLPNQDYTFAWEIFWMLWTVDPRLVRLGSEDSLASKVS